MNVQKSKTKEYEEKILILEKENTLFKKLYFELLESVEKAKIEKS